MQHICIKCIEAKTKKNAITQNEDANTYWIEEAKNYTKLRA